MGYHDNWFEQQRADAIARRRARWARLWRRLTFRGPRPFPCACGAVIPVQGRDAWVERHITECPVQVRFARGEGVICRHGVPVLDGRHAAGVVCGTAR